MHEVNECEGKSSKKLACGGDMEQKSTQSKLSEEKTCSGENANIMENVSSDFNLCYISNFESWVNRTLKVETDEGLENTVHKVASTLSNMCKKTECIATIRSSVNNIGSQARELESLDGDN